MFVNDPIADMLTRIRNATLVKKDKVRIPYSKMKESILKIFVDEGLVFDYKVLTTPSGKKDLLVGLKYHSRKRDSVIRGLKRISKPGRRVYADVDNMPRVLRGLGLAVVSTSSGIMTDKACREKKVGGEILCYAW